MPSRHYAHFSGELDTGLVNPFEATTTAPAETDEPDENEPPTKEEILSNPVGVVVDQIVNFFTGDPAVNFANLSKLVKILYFAF